MTLEQVMSFICNPVDPSLIIIEAVDFTRPGIGSKRILEKFEKKLL